MVTRGSEVRTCSGPQWVHLKTWMWFRKWDAGVKKKGTHSCLWGTHVQEQETNGDTTFNQYSILL